MATTGRYWASSRSTMYSKFCCQMDGAEISELWQQRTEGCSESEDPRHSRSAERDRQPIADRVSGPQRPVGRHGAAPAPTPKVAERLHRPRRPHMVLMKDERWALAVGNRTDDTHTCSVAVWMRLVAHVLNGVCVPVIGCTQATQP